MTRDRDIIAELFSNKLTRRVIEHFLKTGEPLKVPGIQVGREESGIDDCDPVGAYSTWAEPKYGWIPTNEALRKIINAIKELP